MRWRLPINTILLISPEGTNLGNVTKEAAERIAEDQYGLDLAEVRPGVYKILDVGKLQYEASKRKVVKSKPIKEMKFKLNIGESDFAIKIGHVRRFLKDGSPVKITIWFTGREVSRPEAGVNLMESVSEAVEDVGNATINRSLQGRNMNMTIVPGKK